MTKILWLLLINVGLLCTGGYGVRISGTDFNDDYMDREAEDINGVDNDPDAKLAEACLVQILGPSVTCIMKSLHKWDVNPYQLKVNINDKPTCCSIWEMTDCLKIKAQIYCTEEEFTAFETHMNTQTQHRNEKNCSHFQYNTNACTDEQQDSEDSPVLTKVSFRENNHFLNTNEIEDEVTPPPKKPHLFVKKHHGNSHPVAKHFPRDMSMDELTLAQRLLDRVDRITINHVIIDLHSVGRHDSVPNQDMANPNQEIDSEP